jgi:coenzyme F420 hydrogenase subunit beta
MRDAVLPREEQVHEGVFGRYRRVVAARCTYPEILARCQDGGVVTAILCHGLREGLFDGACVSAADETMPAAPKPKVVTTVDEAITSASSWYTYCPNDLALADADRMGLKRVCFVGVPCQITPVRKIQLADPAFLNNGRKKDKHIERQTKFLKGFGEIVDFTIGLLCTEVFTYEGLMVQKIQEEMGFLTDEVQRRECAGLQEGRRGGGDEPTRRRVRPAGAPHCGDFTAGWPTSPAAGSRAWTGRSPCCGRAARAFDDMVRRGPRDTPYGGVRELDEDAAARRSSATACRCR